MVYWDAVFVPLTVDSFICFFNLFYVLMAGGLGHRSTSGWAALGHIFKVQN